MSMSPAHAAEILASRLETFSQLLDKVEAQWEGRDLSELGASRLAPDMHPLTWQIAAVALQGQLFAAWCNGQVLANSVPELPDWRTARSQLSDAQLKVDEVRALAVMPETKRIEIAMIGMYLDLTGQRYVDEWLLPNLYFHITTAYAIMRMNGATIGKADYMAFLMGELRPMSELADEPPHG